MAIGDEFDSNTINAYQLADFADSCELARSLVAKHLIYMINKLGLSLDNIKDMTITKNEEEKKYLTIYKKIVRALCKHLLREAGEITSIRL